MTARTLNLVVPLAQEATDKRTKDTAGNCRAASGAALRLSDRAQSVDSTTGRRTSPTRPTPGIRTSTTATRTTTTATTSCAPEPSADRARIHRHADFSFEDLVQAYLDCRRTKRSSAIAQAFEINQEQNLARLADELRTGVYRPSRSICFVITRPKAREVWAAEFRDRIVHHLLYNRVAPTIQARFITDSCACIPGRGTLYAAKRLETKIRSITRNWSAPAHYLRCDLANFFVSIDKHVLDALLEKHITAPWWLELARTILWHDPRNDCLYKGNRHLFALVPPHKRLSDQPAHLGLPIGNLSSQFFANIYLDALDQHVKHHIRARRYVRYVDDFILLHESPQWLNSAREQIEHYLAGHLNAALNPRKTILQPIERGVDFVGHVIKPWRRTTRRRTFKQAIQRTAQSTPEELLARANSYFGLLRQSTHSHHDRAQLSNTIRKLGHSVSYDLTKAYRRATLIEDSKQ